MPLWLRMLTIVTFGCALIGLFGPLSAQGGSVALLRSPESLPGIVFFVGAMVICLLAWRQAPGGVFLMLLLQLLQVVSVTGPGRATFIARCGPVMQLLVAPDGYQLDGGLQALFADSSPSSGLSLLTSIGTMNATTLELASYVVGINLLPLFLAWQIWVYLGQPAASARAAA